MKKVKLLFVLMISIAFINNAKNINFFDDDFLSQMSVLDTDKPVYLYCKSGGRSGKAAIQLKEAGFTKVYDLEGGITAWIEKEKALPNK
jgi:phage shock protein E